ncbi:hypothetical protein F5888DRAFT_1734646 [Russula emetica]|nr:hypothetical protein F5888DRAFT_1734646 [Russula emetica]
MTTRVPTTCRTDFDLVVRLGMYLRPSSSQSRGLRGIVFHLTSATLWRAMGLLPTSPSIDIPLYSTSALALSLFLTLFWTAIPTRISTLLATAGGMHNMQAIA